MAHRVPASSERMPTRQPSKQQETRPSAVCADASKARTDMRSTPRCRFGRLGAARRESRSRAIALSQRGSSGSELKAHSIAQRGVAIPQQGHAEQRGTSGSRRREGLVDQSARFVERSTSGSSVATVRVDAAAVSLVPHDATRSEAGSSARDDQALHWLAETWGRATAIGRLARSRPRSAVPEALPRFVSGSKRAVHSVRRDAGCGCDAAITVGDKERDRGAG